MIELRRLRYLVVLAMRLSYARAADELGLSQSALTRAIQSLEKELGMRLFDRDQGGVTLTEQGRSVVEKAEALLINAKDFEHQVKQTARGLDGRIRFGMVPVAARALLPATLPPRIKRAPEFRHEISVQESEPLWHLLTAREIEFFVSVDWELSNTLPVRCDLLGEVPISLLVRPGHPLLDGSADPGDFPVLVASTMSAGRRFPADLGARMGMAVHLIEDLGTMAAITQVTDAVWVSSTFVAAAELAAGTLQELRRPEFDLRGSFKMMMYSLERCPLSPAAAELRQAFIERFRQLKASNGCVAV